MLCFYVFSARLSCVHEALQRRALDLQDSLVLTEFLQNMQLEEMLNQRNHKEVRWGKDGTKKEMRESVFGSAFACIK